MTANLFKVYRNFKDIVHDPANPLCRPIKGEKRAVAKSALKKQFPDKYQQDCEKKADKVLLANGNLQDIISLDAAKLMRHEVLSENDFHKDEIRSYQKLQMKREKIEQTS